MAANQTICPKCKQASSSEREIVDKSCRQCGFYTDQDAELFFLREGYELPIKLPIGWCAIQPMVCGEYDVLVNMTHDTIGARICFKNGYDAYKFLTTWVGKAMPDPGTHNITKIKD